MKRHLLLAAISILALNVASHQLYAAELETPAPPEGAAPARERAAPAAERPAPAAQRERAPARERAARPTRAPVQRQAAAQSSPSSSFTGTQVGGFGGGNAGGGGFADPDSCSTTFNQSSQNQSISFSSSQSQSGSFSSSQSQSGSFSSSQSVSSSPQNLPLTFDPRCGTTVANVNRSPIAFSGGGEISHMIALGPYWVAGVAVDVSGSGMNASGTQTGTKVVAGTPINETFSTNQRQAFTTTYRASIGVVAFPNILIFLTGGGATGKVSGNFAYTAVQPSGGPASVASGSGSWNETRTGYSLGGGVTFAYPVVLGGRITVEYLYTNLGTVNQVIPVVSGPNASTALVSLKTENSTVRAKLSWGL